MDNLHIKPFRLRQFLHKSSIYIENKVKHSKTLTIMKIWVGFNEVDIRSGPALTAGSGDLRSTLGLVNSSKRFLFIH